MQCFKKKKHKGISFQLICTYSKIFFYLVRENTVNTDENFLTLITVDFPQLLDDLQNRLTFHINIEQGFF